MRKERKECILGLVNDDFIAAKEGMEIGQQGVYKPPILVKDIGNWEVVVVVDG